MSHFGTTAAGQDVEKITLSDGDLTVDILTFGAVVQSVRLAGVAYDLTLGSENLADYEGELRYHGSLIGPVVNRISTARIKIAGMMYELERNYLGHIHLHSGSTATHLRVWDVLEQTAATVTLQCKLADGDCDLPGNRDIRVTFAVEAPATLMMTVTGTTDTATALSFANHSYWNLDGTPNWDGHALEIAADAYLPSTPEFYPTGEVVDVTDTKMDFRKMRVIRVGDDVFDNNFCLSDTKEPLRDVLRLRGQSGVTLTMATTEPGVQIYDAWAAAKFGRIPHEGIAIEAQMWPDAPNNPGFPSIIVRPDAPYRHETHFRFEA